MVNSHRALYLLNPATVAKDFRQSYDGGIDVKMDVYTVDCTDITDFSDAWAVRYMCNIPKRTGKATVWMPLTVDEETLYAMNLVARHNRLVLGQLGDGDPLLSVFHRHCTPTEVLRPGEELHINIKLRFGGRYRLISPEGLDSAKMASGDRIKVTGYYCGYSDENYAEELFKRYFGNPHYERVDTDDIKLNRIEEIIQAFQEHIASLARRGIGRSPEVFAGGRVLSSPRLQL